MDLLIHVGEPFEADGGLRIAFNVAVIHEGRGYVFTGSVPFVFGQALNARRTVLIDTAKLIVSDRLSLVDPIWDRSDVYGV